MGAMVPTGTGSYRYDGTAAGIQYHDINSGRWTDQSKLSKQGGGIPIKMWDPTTGRFVDQGSPQGQALRDARKKKADQWAKDAQAAEMEAVNAQEVEDRIAENKDRNAEINALAMSQAGNGLLTGGAGGAGGTLGRGIYQRKQTGTSPNQAVADLNSANAAALAESRRKLVAAQQKANVGYSNSQLGYAGAINEIASKLPKPQVGSGLSNLSGLMGTA